METEGPRASRGRVVRRVLQITLSLAVVAAIYTVALPRIAAFSDVWGAIGAMTWLELATLFLLGVWNIATYWLVEKASFPAINYWQAMKVVLTSTAISNTMPAGGAFGLSVTTAMYRSYGFKGSEIGLSIVIQGVWNNFVKLGMPVVALGLLALTEPVTAPLIVASVIGLVMLVVALAGFGLTLKSEKAAVWVGGKLQTIVTGLRRLTRKPASESDLASSVVGFRHQTIELIRTRWFRLTWAALVSHLTLYLLLLLTLRHVGVSEAQVSWIQVLAAFAFVRLVSAIPITPGGIGVVELGMTAALVAAGGDDAKVVAGVLVWRVLTYLMPIPLGGAAYLKWRMGAKRRRMRLAAAAMLLLAGVACGGASGPTPAGGAPTPNAITVGSFDFSENVVLAEIYATALEQNGFEVERAFDLGSRELVEPALEQGEIDMLPEYLGTALDFVTLGRAKITPAPRAMHERLTEAMGERGIHVLDFGPAQDRNGIVVTEATAGRYNLIAISDLEGVASQMIFGGPPECPQRPSCLQGLEDVYGLDFAAFQPLDVGGPATVAALTGGEVDVGLLFTTDPSITTEDLVLLEDDRRLQPAENVVPIVRTQIVEEFGVGFTRLIDRITNKLSTDDLRDLNEFVQVDGRKPAAVAEQWLRREGLSP